jgi:glycosyltransferase involved in cell wall biosynthesis
MKTALLLVDDDFDVKHVGVRRFVQWYCLQLERLGYSWTLATVKNRQIVPISSDLNLNDFFNQTSDLSKTMPLAITPSLKINTLEKISKKGKKSQIRWGTLKLNPAEFTLSIISNPWLAGNNAEVLREYRFDFGIVHDLVPNLLAAGILNFPMSIDANNFAYEHRLGFEFYKSNCKEIISVSENTRIDFEKLFDESQIQKHSVIVPFSISPNKNNQYKTGLIRPKILMVNALDHRKNIKVAGLALSELSKRIDFELLLLGAERVEIGEVELFFSEISKPGVNASWQRLYSDDFYAQALAESSVLFFPTQYEGLGLPILEAQANGLPVVSGNNSSCLQLNMNLNLLVNPNEPDALANTLFDVISNPEVAIRGERLSNSLRYQLGNYDNLEDIISREHKN